jgi:hypothetical protein
MGRVEELNAGNLGASEAIYLLKPHYRGCARRVQVVRGALTVFAEEPVRNLFPFFLPLQGLDPTYGQNDDRAYVSNFLYQLCTSSPDQVHGSIRSANPFLQHSLEE